ncbi:MAG: hypothetical protein ABI947_04250 [Chloroflexota bacterium]
MDDGNTRKLVLTQEDRQKLRDAYEQTVREEEYEKAFDEANRQLRERQPLVDTVNDLNDVLLVVSTLALSENWNRLRDERFIKEIGGFHRVISELCKNIDDPDIATWDSRMQIIVDAYIEGINLLIVKRNKDYLREIIVKFGPKQMRLPPQKLIFVPTPDRLE